MSITPPAPDDPFGAVAASPRPSGAPAAEPPRRRERWAVPLLVALTVAGVAYGFANTDAPAERVAIAGAPAGGGGGEAALGDGGSLVEPQNLRAALAASRKAAGPVSRLSGLRVSAENVQAEWVVSPTSARRTYADRTGRVQRLGPDSVSTGPSLGLSRVPLDAPWRIARRLAARAEVPVGAVDYVLLRVEDGRPAWLAYLTQEVDAIKRLNPVFASPDGRRIRPNGPGARR